MPNKFTTPPTKKRNDQQSATPQKQMFADLETAFNDVRRLKITKEQKLDLFAEKCTNLLIGQSNNIKKNSKNTVAKFLYFIKNDKTKVDVSPTKTQEKKLSRAISDEGHSLMMNYDALGESLKPVKTTNDTLQSYISRLAWDDDNQSEILIIDSQYQNVMQAHYNDFCKKVSFNICLVMLASSTLLVASTYGALPVMTALIITSSTNLVSNSVVQYYNHKKLSIITDNNAPVLASAIVSTLIILAGGALAITAMLYASQATLPVLAAALMVLTLYMAFEYTKLKGQTSIAEDQIKPSSSNDDPVNSENLGKGNNLYTKFVSLFFYPTDTNNASNFLKLEQGDNNLSNQI